MVDVSTPGSSSSVDLRNVRIYRRNAFLLIGSGDGGAIDHAVAELLTPRMVFRRLVFERPKFGYAAVKSQMTVQLEAMYSYDDLGRLQCMGGFLSFIVRVLKLSGYTVEVENLDLPRTRPDAFTPDWDRIADVQFRPGQEDCMLAMVASEGGVIQAAPGFGKSFTIAQFARLYPNAKFAITVKSTENANSLHRDLVAVLPNVGRVGAGNRNFGRVTVYNADSLHYCDGDIDFLIADEVHELVADKYTASLSNVVVAACSRNFGFTATFGERADGAQARAEGLFGPKVFLNTQQESEKAGSVVPVEIHWHDVPMDNPVNGKSGVSRKRWGIWRNELRNKLIAKIALEQDDTDQVLIIVGTTEHAAYLKELLPDFTLVHGPMSSSDLAYYKKQGLLPDDYVSPKAKDLARIKTEFERRELLKVIATGKWATGVSFESLSVLIRADASPGAVLAVQIPGRVTRIHSASGKTVGVVHDFEDRFDPGFRRDALARRRVYVERSWMQVYPSRTSRLQP